MIGRETRVLLRHYLEQGMSKAAIARQVGVSRRTVYRWIESGQLDRELDDEAVRYGPRRPRPSKLDPYKGIVRARLAEYPELSAVRLFQEIRQRATRAATARSSATFAGFGRGLRQSRCSASRLLRATRGRWTSRSSVCPGASGTR